jgi:prevent-host-death family protein
MNNDKRANVSAMMRAVEAGERYTIERGGEPLAVVIPYAEFQKLLDFAASKLT